MFQKFNYDTYQFLNLLERVESDDQYRRLAYIAILTNNYIFLSKNDGTIVGFVIVANVDAYTLCANINFNRYPEYPYEWDEGKILWILDVFIADGHFISDIRKQLRHLVRDRIVYRHDGDKGVISYNCKKQKISESCTVETLSNKIDVIRD